MWTNTAKHWDKWCKLFGNHNHIKRNILQKLYGIGNWQLRGKSADDAASEV